MCKELEAYISPEEATQVYLPLSRLLYLHVDATRSLYRAARAFLAEEEKEVPYVVGIAGSVAAGKSTVAGYCAPWSPSGQVAPRSGW